MNKLNNPKRMMMFGTCGGQQNFRMKSMGKFSSIFMTCSFVVVARLARTQDGEATEERGIGISQ